MAQDDRTRPAADDDDNDDNDDDTQPVKDLLAEHVPLALLVDLVTPEQTSTEILESEGLPDVAWWEPPDDAAELAADDDGDAP
jgi:hypothetical protein